MAHAVREPVRIDVREPKDECRDDDERRNAPWGVRVDLGSGDDSGEHDDRAVDEPAETLAERLAGVERGQTGALRLSHRLMPRRRVRAAGRWRLDLTGP